MLGPWSCTCLWRGHKKQKTKQIGNLSTFKIHQVFTLGLAAPDIIHLLCTYEQRANYSLCVFGLGVLWRSRRRLRPHCDPTPFLPGPSLLGPSLLGPSLLGSSLLGESFLRPSQLGPSLLGPSLLGPFLLCPCLLGPSLLGPLPSPSSPHLNPAHPVTSYHP